MVINKRMHAINKLLEYASWLYLKNYEVKNEDMYKHYRKLYLLAESEICGHISLKYRIQYHERIFKPYYDGLVTKEALLLALEGVKFNVVT